MDSYFALLDIESWKPVVTALLLPPVPPLLLMLIGAGQIAVRRGLGWTIVISGAVLLWLSACTGASEPLMRRLAPPTSALSSGRIDEIRAALKARQPIAIVVLGGGVQSLAPEYNLSNLSKESLERLRYGLWLSRQTGAPVAFSGGIGWAQTGAASEAQAAARIAAEEFGRPLKWIEDRSRDTRENAALAVALLKPAGIRHIVVVTHGYHMPRSLRAFEQAARGTVTVEAAPMGLARHGQTPLLSWLPSTDGITDMRHIVREWIGRWAGA